MAIALSCFCERRDKCCRREAAVPAAYSPDLNPIEQVFAKLKTLLRKAQERSIDATWKRIGSLLDAFSHKNAPTTSEIADMLQSKMITL
jgi:transposase